MVDAYGGEMVSYHMLLNGDIDFIILSEIPEERSKDLAIVNALIVRGTGGVDSITTVPALRAEDALTQMQKAHNLVSTMAYQTPTEP